MTRLSASSARNGAGKSTLFNACRVALPDSGSVLGRTQVITHLRPESRARLGLARTFQAPELFSKLTVRKHLLLSYRLKYAAPAVWTDVLLGRALRASDDLETERVERTLVRLTWRVRRRASGSANRISRVLSRCTSRNLAPRVLLDLQPRAGLDSHAKR